MRSVRGNDISMIFQEPMTSLNPVMTIGKQIAEALILHRDLDAEGGAGSAPSRCCELVRIPEPQQRAKEYPHQLSGGMRQRAMIAMALACNPKLLIADEPTTALDVTIQAQILELIVELQREFGTAVILITHDLGVVAETARARDRDVCRPQGRGGAVGALFADPSIPIRAACWPRSRGSTCCAARRPRPTACRKSPAWCRRCPIFPRDAPSRRAARAPTKVPQRAPAYEEKQPGHWAACWHSDRWRGLMLSALRSSRSPPEEHFPVRKGLLRRTVGQVYAVDGVSSHRRGRDAGLVGESGCGKTTAGRAVLRLIEPTSGSIEVTGEDITQLARPRCGPTGGRCRSSSRTRSPRSIRA